MTHQQTGSINVIFGPMFSGKTTELLKRIRRYTVAGRECLVLKYKSDTRYSEDDVSTHDKVLFPSLPVAELREATDRLEKTEVVGIDEGQFFRDIVEFSEDLASRGKVVIIACLDGTFQREGFGKVLDLVPRAESVVKLRAVCMSCGDEAPFTRRLTDDTRLEVIGGEDIYAAVCRRCFSDAAAPDSIREKLKKRKGVKIP